MLKEIVGLRATHLEEVDSVSDSLSFTTKSSIVGSKIHELIKNKGDRAYLRGIFQIRGELKASFYPLSKITIKKSLNNNKTVIFDGCFYRKEQYEHLKKNIPYRHFAFSLKASLKDCLSRNKKRRIKMTEKAIKDVYALVSKTKIGTSIETSKKSVKSVVKEILNHLPTRMDGKL